MYSFKTPLSLLTEDYLLSYGDSSFAWLVSSTVSRAWSSSNLSRSSPRMLWNLFLKPIFEVIQDVMIWSWFSSKLMLGSIKEEFDSVYHELCLLASLLAPWWTTIFHFWSIFESTIIHAQFDGMYLWIYMYSLHSSVVSYSPLLVKKEEYSLYYYYLVSHMFLVQKFESHFPFWTTGGDFLSLMFSRGDNGFLESNFYHPVLYSQVHSSSMSFLYWFLSVSASLILLSDFCLTTTFHFLIFSDKDSF